jgi:hypothetical protein
MKDPPEHLHGRGDSLWFCFRRVPQEEDGFRCEEDAIEWGK